jgi:ABC-type phosphate transport system substrate-binding protein
MCAGIAWPQTAPAANVLRLGGTGAGLANIQNLAEAFAKTHPGVVAKVLPSLGSSGGIKALLAGAIDASVSVRRPQERRFERARGELAQMLALFGRRTVVLLRPASVPSALARCHLRRSD